MSGGKGRAGKQDRRLTRTSDAEYALHNVQGAGALSDRGEADKGILGASAVAGDDADVCDIERVDVHFAESVRGEMLHREVEQTVDVVLDGERGEIRDEEGKDVFALRGDVVHRGLVMVAEVAIVLLWLLLLVVIRVRERCDSHRARGAG